ncbi:hypothetical protein FEE95_18770 [Maribacter algarum]|uniref:Outer membrane protein beta-barrel domain-containing protein n=1 Tax=Maribacter algarum (ex Zhang et al. 2020) TaxID=2578118 RepID=A0A5S3PI33_9FLAO|nr:DUF6048 family protein [Maribacter algarum]TMM53938.1 hypothetical protein FEE95_18770 [Maribacter algarum]
MLKYFISTSFVFCFFFGNAQSKPIDTKPKDTVVYKQPYGLRVGVDLSRPTISFFEEEYTGLEFVGDYRLSLKYYLAAELGNEKRTRQEDAYNFTTQGSYIKVGFDYNTYANWYGEQNMIYAGARIAFSTFNHTINNYQIFDSNRYWSPNGFQESGSEPIELESRTATWLEAVMGIKAELFANIYLGGSVRLGALVPNPNKKLDEGEFSNLFIPGFNKVTDNSIFGIGYNFSISYFLPLYKKEKRIKIDKDEPKLIEEEN